jgi:hypothetical protein
VLFEKRFSHGFLSAVVYTRAYGRRQEWMANEFDAAPSWQTNDDVWPHHFAWTAIYELPFGKRRKWVQSTPLRQVAGGWQLSCVRRQLFFPVSDNYFSLSATTTSFA